MLPVKHDHKLGVHLVRICGCNELPLDVVVISLLVVGNVPDIFVELSKLRRKDIRWEQLFRLDVIFVIHHFFEAFLICFVSPGQLTDSKIAQEIEKRLNVVFLKVLLVGQMCRKSCVHGCTNHSEVILLFVHILSQSLCCCLLLACFWVDDVLFFFN